jgi:hypothetical protein
VRGAVTAMLRGGAQYEAGFVSMQLMRSPRAPYWAHAVATTASDWYIGLAERVVIALGSGGCVGARAVTTRDGCP